MGNDMFNDEQLAYARTRLVQYDPACVDCLRDAGKDLAGTTWQCNGHVRAERDRLRERLDQFDAYGFPNVSVALDRVSAAEARCAELEAQKNRALQRAWTAEASLSVRVGMRREFEAILGVSDTMEPGTFEAGMARLRALLAAEAERDSYRKALRDYLDACCGAPGDMDPDLPCELCERARAALAGGE